jgi:nitrite reductase/ring-hydroxylating ferredoxin subunit
MEGQWIKIADNVAEIDFSENNMATITVNGKAVCIAKFGEGLHGCAAKCPHAGALMANGYIDAVGNFVCPLHRYKFSLHNGRNVSGEGYYLKTYEIAVKNDGVYINFEKKKSFFDLLN